MDQEPTLPMIGTLTSVSTKKDGLEGHPGLRGTSRAPTTPQLVHGVASTLRMPECSFLKPFDSLDSPAACARGQGRKSVQFETALSSGGNASDVNGRLERWARP